LKVSYFFATGKTGAILRPQEVPAALPAEVVKFEEFELDCNRYELHRAGRRIKLEKLPMELLILLIEKNGHLATRQEIVDRLWGAAIFLDTEHGINTAIRKIRNVLHDHPEQPRFVQTVTGKGYRFVASIDVISEERGNGNHRGTGLVPAETIQAQADLPVSSPVARSHHRASGLVRKAVLVLVGAIGVVAVFSGLNVRGVRQRLLAHTSRQGAQQIRSLAVLPIENLSGDLSQDFLADGMTEELITELGKSSALRVISRTSVMQYKGTKKPVQEIARELNVDAVLEGTALRSGNHLRITANLVQSSPETHLWAETYDSENGDILRVQQHVADSVAREIRVALSPRDTTTLGDGRSVNPEAQDLYFRGLYALRSAGGGSTQTAVDYLQRAIKKDPNFARAYGVLAIAHAVWYPGDSGPRENMPRGREAALKAVALDNSLAAGHMALAYIDLNYDWNFAEAESEFKRALELDPNFAVARNFYARELVISGRTDEALVQVRRALELQPYAGLDYPAWVFYLAHRYNDSLELAQKMVAIDPNFSWGRWALAANYEQVGRKKESAEEYLQFEILSGSSPQRITRLREGLARLGAKGFWQASLEDYLRTAKSNYAPPVLVAGVYMRLGDKARALHWLEKGYQERDDLMIDLNVDPVFNALRSEPRFQDLVRRVGLPDGKPQT
jgi:TolB-like protein/DNA-binding winged helix-turn-helix (wHTH) protein/tetratricopeptide (TPR) repeat protein